MVDQATQCFEIADKLWCAQSLDDIRAICCEAAAAFGYRHCSLKGYLPRSTSIISVHDVPAEWEAHYTRQGYAQFDPRIRYATRNSAPVDWSELSYASGAAGRMERQVMREAREHGLRCGISIPAHGAGAEVCLLNLSTPEDRTPACPATRQTLRFVANSMQDAVRRLHQEAPGDPAVVPHLTSREREVLQWTAHGKTSWEIARILDLSENTVVFHIRNAVSKLQATNRPQAVAKAMASSYITVY